MSTLTSPQLKTNEQQKQQNTSRPIKVAHITDLHWLSDRRLNFWELWGKRLIGYANLHFVGRKKYFSDQSRNDVLRKMDELNPDLIICTGDLSSTGLDEEFNMAYEGLKPFMEKYPFFLIPGNHDIYVPQNQQEMSIYKRFYKYMHHFIPEDLIKLHNINPTDTAKQDVVVSTSTSKTNNPNSQVQQLFTTQHNHISTEVQMKYPNLSLFIHDNNNKKNENENENTNNNHVFIIGLNPCRPTKIGSNGLYPKEQLDELHQLLNNINDITLSLDNKTQQIQPFIILATHYPVIDRSGYDYQSIHSHHGTKNNHDLLSILDTALIKPGLVIHGHDHLGMAIGLSTQRQSVNDNNNDNSTSTDYNETTTKKIEFHPFAQPPTCINPMKMLKYMKTANINYNTNITLSNDEYESYISDIRATTTNTDTIQEQASITKDTTQKFYQPKIKDVLTAYHHVYDENTLGDIYKTLLEDQKQQYNVFKARVAIQKNISPKSTTTHNTHNNQNEVQQVDNENIISKQYGMYNHSTIPLNLQQYLTNKLQPFHLVRPVEEMNLFLSHPEKNIMDNISILPTSGNNQSITNNLDFDAITKYNMEKVTIPIHNPGSASLANTPMKNPKDWPKYAGFNIYNLIPRSNSIDIPYKQQSGYASCDYYKMNVQHFQHTGKYQTNAQTDEVLNPKIEQIPYKYPLF